MRFHLKDGFVLNIAAESNKRKREEDDQKETKSEEKEEKEKESKKRKVEKDESEEESTELPPGTNESDQPQDPITAKKRKREDRNLERLQERARKDSTKKHRKAEVTKLKGVFGKYGTVAFVQFDEEDLSQIKSGFVRFAANPNEAKAAVEALEEINKNNLEAKLQFETLRVIEGEEEEKYALLPLTPPHNTPTTPQHSHSPDRYYKEMNDEQEKRRQRGGNRKGGRGRGGGGRGRKGGRGGQRGRGRGGGRGGGGRGGRGGGAEKPKVVAKGEDFEDKDIEMGLDANGRPRKPTGGAVSTIPSIGAASKKKANNK